MPRTILAIYDSIHDGAPRFSQTHEFLEMPLNHLGYRLEYHDVRQPLPEIGDDVKGAVVWFYPDTQMDDPEVWLDWLDSLLAKKRKLFVIGGLGVSDKFLQQESGLERLNHVLHQIGVHDPGSWHSLVYDLEIIERDPWLVDFERRYKGVMPAFESVTAYGKHSRSHLKVKSPQHNGEVSDMIITHPNGGYVVQHYAVYKIIDEDGRVILSEWYLNPFRLMRKIFDTESLPKADVTTLFGKRIFYSHLDGDGWNNITEVASYRNKKVLSSEVLYEEIFTDYSDLPFTVGLIVSELREDCYGVPRSKEVARKVLALPNVEVGSHTYSHPLYWGFFAHGNATEKEQEYLDQYPRAPYQRFFISEFISPNKKEDLREYSPDSAPEHDPMRGIVAPWGGEEYVMGYYKTPRSFACEPFNLDREIRGAIEFINDLAGGKQVKIYQWSGNTVPFEAAIRAAREMGVSNINGGDSRFDVEYPSYSSVSSIAVPVGEERQIYSSNSNENTYTDDWTERFFGFRYLKTTVENTETPIRVDPFNVYFHTYSGEKQASLNALKENLNYARKQDIIPIFASEFAAIADSFFDVEFVRIALDTWKVKSRGNVQTIRFDKATLKTTDFNKSKGVLGQLHYQGSLYVALDSSMDEVIISLKNKLNLGEYDDAERPYLIKSNWKIKGLHVGKDVLSFAASGFGEGVSVWKMQQCGGYTVQVQDTEGKVTKYKGTTEHSCVLRVTVPASEKPLGVTISRAE